MLADLDLFWHNPTVVRLIALVAVALMVVTIWLFQRRKRSGNGAAIVCLILSIALHAALVIWVPKLSSYFVGGGNGADQAEIPGTHMVSVALFEPEMKSSEIASTDPTTEDVAIPDALDSAAATLQPLPLTTPMASLQTPTKNTEALQNQTPDTELPPPAAMDLPTVPAALASMPTTAKQSTPPDEDILGTWLSKALTAQEEPVTTSDPVDTASQEISVPPTPNASPTHDHKAAAPPASIAGAVDEDFAGRQGAAKVQALNATGGDADTEAAVRQALKYLTQLQREDGAWDPITTGAGRERAPLGLERGSAGKRAETGLTGLALLALLGAGNTHQSGPYHDPVYRGLVYLLGRQRSDGSMAGDASVYAAHYCHAMASLALAETAAMTGDEVAIRATQKAITYSKSTQHPVTGGWRYTRGDAGDLSQLGWQAMLVDGAVRAGAMGNNTEMQQGIARFLDSVSSGRAGGLASYRPGERPSASMTAEALATRLLIGQNVSQATIREAESVLLDALPGKHAGPDNLYYWYYATLALHQRQDEAWQTWNAALKSRLLATQRPDGSWPDSTLWGGYGGTVYTTSMATLCLESYYRHSLR